MRAPLWFAAALPLTLFVRGSADLGLQSLLLPRQRTSQVTLGILLGLALSKDVLFAGWWGYLKGLGWTAIVTGVVCDLGRVTIDYREKQRLLREARDEALRLKLAPHFLFNALNTVKAQIASDPQGAASTVDRLAGLLRQVLDTSGRLTVPLREELDFVEAYLGIERLRLGDRLRVKLEIAEGAEAVEIPPLSLQSLVENAVKHGVAPREGGGEIRIWARIEPWRNREKVWFGVESPLSTGAEPGPRVGLETLRARLRDPTDLVTEIRGRRFLAEFGCYRDEWIARA